MSTAFALSVALLSIATLVAVLAEAIVVIRVTRRLAARRRSRITAPVHPTLLAMLAEDAPAPRHTLLTELLALDDRTWAALRPTVVELLGKLRGDAHDALRTLVERRGEVDRARRRARRMGAVGRARAAELLGALEDDYVTPDLVRLLDDRDAEVRQVAARALGRSGDAQAATPLLRCLSRSGVPPRVVAQALLRLGAGAQSGLVRALDEPDELVRGVAVEILGLTDAVSASRSVELCLRNDASLEVQIRAARALGRVGLPASLAALVDATALQRPAPLRVVSARALGDLGHPAAVPRLRELLADPVHRVGANAARSLCRLGPAGEHALEQAAAADPAGGHAAEALVRLRLTATAGNRATTLVGA